MSASSFLQRKTFGGFALWFSSKHLSGSYGCVAYGGPGCCPVTARSKVGCDTTLVHHSLAAVRGFCLCVLKCVLSLAKYDSVFPDRSVFFLSINLPLCVYFFYPVTMDRDQIYRSIG